MKNLVLLITLILTYTFCFSQTELKQITKKDKVNSIIEKYQVLKENRKVKHGKYEKFLAGKLIETGQYSNDEKSGVWKYYGYKKELNLEYDYDNGKVLFYEKPEKSDTLDRPVIYLGSSYAPRRLIQVNLRYPIKAQENGKSGRIIISIEIDESGKVYDYKIKQKVYPVLDEEALRVVKLIQGDWLPAIYKGEKIKSSYEFPVVFQLQ